MSVFFFRFLFRPRFLALAERGCASPLRVRRARISGLVQRALGGARARERCGAGDERDRQISPPEHAWPRCVDGRTASVQRRVFVILFFGGALIDHAASNKETDKDGA